MSFVKLRNGLSGEILLMLPRLVDGEVLWIREALVGQLPFRLNIQKSNVLEPLDFVLKQLKPYLKFRLI